jgi:hypothetical protein
MPVGSSSSTMGCRSSVSISFCTQGESFPDQLAETTDIVCTCSPGHLIIAVSGSYHRHPALERVVLLGVPRDPQHCFIGTKMVRFEYKQDVQALRIFDLHLALDEGIKLSWR